MEKVSFLPAEQRVLILPDSAPEKIGHIILPSGHATDKSRIGTVIVAGNGNIDNPMKYMAGQKVMFSQYAGVEVEFNLGDGEKTYLLMNQIDIMGTIIL